MTATSSTELSYDACLDLLRSTPVGRIACNVHGGPIILPVAYRLVEIESIRWVAIRTRRGNVLDLPGTAVAFEIDGMDAERQRGWSVLVRGTLQRVDPDAAGFRERFDPEPWLDDDRDAWLAIEPFSITGRALTDPDAPWPFEPSAYL